MNNGNVNNNNKNNTNYVLAVSEFQGIQEAGTPVFYLSEEGLWQAYQKCLEHKKSTASAVLFRINELANVRQLHKEISDGTYYPGTSIAFITENREVFAAAFRDRVVHTWVAERIIPLLERQFVPTTWNCREGKGVYWAVQNLREQIRRVSEDYTKDAYIIIFDLSGFFMGINREKAAGRLCKFVADRYVGEDKAVLLHLIRLIITHAPEEDCIRYGSPEEWAALPERKSLFHRHGLPIGDLLSQLDGNFELDIIDHFITRHFESDRYVDDFALISQDKQALLHAMPVIRQMLELTCGAKVNPHKFKLCHWRDGFKYLGVIFREGKAYPSGKTIGKACNAVRYYNHIRNKESRAQDFVSSLNSYLGLMKHYDTVEQREKICNSIAPEWNTYIIISPGCEKINVKYPRRQRLRSKLRQERRFFNNLKYSIKCAQSELS